MFAKVIGFFKPPEYDSLEQTQKARFLHFSLLVATCACIVLGIQNISENSDLHIFLFIVGAISLLCIPANQRGYYSPVALFVSGLVLGVITYSLLAGVGLKDAGLIAYPIFILFTSYLFSKKAVFYTTFLSIASVILVYLLVRQGVLNPNVKYTNENQLVVILVMLPAAGVLLWAVTDNWEKITGDLRDTYDLTLSGWGRALEYRDRETEGHSQHVVELTLALAQQMGIQGRKLEDIRRGALLHDIGKMAVPDAILLKKGNLTEEEWKILRQHPRHARDLLQDIPFLKPALDIPYSHHERWDGSGYPEGLAHEAIPLAARIFAVVDVWDALISDRPYRPAWPEATALEYIRDQSGRQFDPWVVETFMKTMMRNQHTTGEAQV